MNGNARFVAAGVGRTFRFSALFRFVVSAGGSFLLLMLISQPLAAMSGRAQSPGGHAQLLEYVQGASTPHMGERSVDHRGVLGYRYAMGAVAAVYSSGGGGRWLVAQPSRITRSTRRGVPQGTSFDVFELDGELLVCASGCFDKGASQTRTYHPLTQPAGDFVRLRFHHPGTAQSYWTLDTASGVRSEFGATSDSRVDAAVHDGGLVSESHPRTWAISERRAGGTLTTFAYLENPDGGGGHYLTAVIEGREGAGTHGHQATRIEYSEFADLGPGTIDGRSGQVVQRRRLATRVDVRMGVTREGRGGRSKASYLLRWDVTPARPVLERITPLGSESGSSRAPLVFEYGEGARFGEPVRLGFKSTPLDYPPDPDVLVLGSDGKRTSAFLERYASQSAQGYPIAAGLDEFRDVDGDHVPDRVFYSPDEDALLYQRNRGPGEFDAEANAYVFSGDLHTLASRFPLAGQIGRSEMLPILSNESVTESGYITISHDRYLPRGVTLKDFKSLLSANSLLYAATERQALIMDLDGDGALDYLTKAFDACDGDGVGAEEWLPGSDYDETHRYQRGDLGVIWGAPDVTERPFNQDVLATGVPSVECLAADTAISTQVSEPDDSGSPYAWYVDATFADINGDGLLDWIRVPAEYSIEEADRQPTSAHQVHFNGGRGRSGGVFGPARQLLPADSGPVSGAWRWAPLAVSHRYIDLNGDGVADRFVGNDPFLPSTTEAGRDRVSWGHGRGFSGLTFTRDVERLSPDGRVSQAEQVFLNDEPFTAWKQETFDIDGDGIADSITAEPSGGDYPVRLRVRRIDEADEAAGYDVLDFSGEVLGATSQGAILKRDRLYVSESHAGDTVIGGSRFVDLNGDGLPDWVSTLHYDLDGDFLADRVVRFNEGRPRTLLKSVGLGEGARFARTEIAYTGVDYSQQAPGYAPNRLVVARITEHDDLGVAHSNDYTYRDGAYDAATGMDFGFGEVETRHPDGTVTQAYYHTDIEVPALRGRLVRKVTRGGGEPGGTHSLSELALLPASRAPILSTRKYDYIDLCAEQATAESHCNRGTWPAYTEADGEMSPSEIYGRRVPLVNRILRVAATEERTPDGAIDGADALVRQGELRKRTEYEYDVRGRVTVAHRLGMVDAEGSDIGTDRVRVTYEYVDAQDDDLRVEQIIESRQAFTYYSEDVPNLERVIRQDKRTFDDAGRLEQHEVKVRHPLTGEFEVVSSTTREYDACGNVDAVIDGAGHKTRYTYDPLYCAYRTSERAPSSGMPTALVTQYHYDTDDDGSLDDELMDLHKVVTPDLSVTRLGRDAFGRITELASEGAPLSDPTMRIEYPDAVPSTPGPRRFRIEAHPGDGVPADTVGYVDGFGRLVQVAEQSGEGWRKHYRWQRIGAGSTSGTPSGPVVSRYHLSADTFARGSDYDRAAQPPPMAVATHEYVNAAGVRVLEQASPGGLLHLVERIGTVMRTTDTTGRVVQNTADPAYGQVDTAVFDADGTPLNTETSRQWANRSVFTDQAGNRLITWRDAAGQTRRVEGPNLGTVDYEYDAAGRLVREARADGTVTTRTYDAAGRPLEEYAGDERRIRWFYDGDNNGDGSLEIGEQPVPGRMTRVLDEAGEVTYTYTDAGRLASETRVIDGQPWTTAFDYDDFGRQVQVHYPDGRTTLEQQYQPDGTLERMLVERDEGGLASVRSIVDGLEQDALGRVTRAAYGNGTATEHQYYGAGGGHRLEAVDYPDIGGDPNEWSYAYDGVGNITAIDASYNPHDRTFRYDALERLTAVLPGDADAATHPSETFGFEARTGNLAQFNDRTRRFGEGAAGPHALTTTGDGRRLRYDARGNLIDRGDLRLIYNEADRLVRTVDKTSPSNPTHAWSFDAADPDAALVGGRDAVLHQTYVLAGRLDTGLAFTGSTSVSAELPAEALDGREDFSVSLWVNTTGSGDGLISAAHAGEDNEFLLFDQSSLRMFLKGTAINTGVNVADGRWHHLVVTRAGDTVTLYVDGIAVERETDEASGAAVTWAGAPSGALAVDPGGLLLGQEQDAVGVSRLNSDAQAYAGRLDEVSVHDHALTASAVRSLHLAQSPAAHWSFSEQRGGAARDRMQGIRATLWGDPDHLHWDQGRRGGGVRLDGSLNARVSLPAYLLDGAGDFSLSLSLRSEGSGDGILSAAHAGEDNELLLYDQSDLKVYFKGTVRHIGADLADGAWHDLTLTREGRLMEVFVDGDMADAWTVTDDALVVDDGGLLLGQEQDAVGYASTGQPEQAFSGSLDEVRIDHHALSVPAIAEWHREQRIERPRARWRFDDVANDSTAFDGLLEAISYTVHSTGTLDAADGVSGRAASFRGDLSSYAELPAEVLDGARDFSLSLWVKTDHGGQGLLTGANAVQGNELLLYDARSLRVYLKGASSGTGVDIADGQWHHVAVTRSERQVVVYVDGERVHVWNDAPGEPLEIAPGGLLLGQEQDGVGVGELNDPGQAFAGAMDELRIHNQLLTAADVRNLVREPGLTGSPTRAAEYRYTYDHTGRRVKKDGPKGTTYYINDHYVEHNGEAEHYYWIGDQRVAADIDGQMAWYHADHLGSTVLTTDTGGQPQREIRYSAYGEARTTELGHDSTTTPRFTYTGMERDGNGLMYYNARYYDPELGIFTRADTVFDTNQPTFNSYAYVGYNPVRYNDPSGHGLGTRAAIGAGLGAVIGATYTIIQNRDHLDEEETWVKVGIAAAAGAVAGATYAVGAHAAGRYVAMDGGSALGGINAGIYNVTHQGLEMGATEAGLLTGDNARHSFNEGELLVAMHAGRVVAPLMSATVGAIRSSVIKPIVARAKSSLNAAVKRASGGLLPSAGSGHSLSQNMQLATVSRASVRMMNGNVMLKRIGYLTARSIQSGYDRLSGLSYYYVATGANNTMRDSYLARFMR